jgi:hypothetical protein
MLSLILVKYRISPVLRLEHVLLNYKHAVALVPGDPVQLESRASNKILSTLNSFCASVLDTKYITSRWNDLVEPTDRQSYPKEG